MAGLIDRLRALLPTALLLAVAAPLPAQIPSDADWRTFDTEHFRVVYVEGLEASARRAADRAEDAYALLSRELVRPPRGRIDLVVADNVDFSNGFAVPIPRNRIVVYTHPPVDEPSLAFMDDWLELVVLHELVHIFHLDYAAGVWRPLRAVFGRNLAFFPEVFAPAWVAEGLATYYESRLTGAGRVRGTMHDMVLRTAVLEDAFFSIDRVTAEPVLWPAARSRYVYGSLFIEHLARRYGPERVPEFVEAYGARSLPFAVNATARRVFGTTLTREWAAWRDSLSLHYRAQADSLRAAGLTVPEILAGGGYYAVAPRWAPDGERIAFVEANGREEPATRILHPDGRVDKVARRNSLGPVSWSPDGRALLDAQLDHVDPFRIYSDLYRVEVDGEADRLTREARVWAPALHPGGDRAVVVTNAGGTNALAVQDLRTGSRRLLTTPSLDVAWGAPRWSPAGDRIAAARWRAGGRYDVVVLDTLGAVVEEITADRAVDATPAWSPDGRYLVFSSDRTGIPNLFAYDFRTRTLQQVTNVLSGAFDPDVSPDGRWIAFSYYRADGYYIARIPFEPTRWRPAPPVHPRFGAETDPSRFAETAGGEAREYSSLTSLPPTGWSFLLDAGTALGAAVGAAAFGSDVVDRHFWAGQLLGYPEDSRFDGLLEYRYRGWGNPVLSLTLGNDWSVASAATGSNGALLERERRAAASLALLRPRLRSNAWVSAGAELVDRDHVRADEAEAGADPATRPLDAGARLAAGWSSARAFARDLGPQEGFLASASVGGHRYLGRAGDSADGRGYLRFTTVGRGYHGIGGLPGFARHVVTARVEAGAETGSAGPGFSVGGAEQGISTSPLTPGAPSHRLRLPVRGFPEGVQRGNRAVSATAEYRFPLALVERGIGLLPLALNQVWGAAFVDGAAAWCAGGCEGLAPRATADLDPLVSAGAELVVDLRLFFLGDLPLRLGLGVPLRGPDAGSPRGYFRLGL